MRPWVVHDAWGIRRNKAKVIVSFQDELPHTQRLYIRRSGHHGRYHRSTAAKNAFKHVHPCPATGVSSGRCSGSVIDHVNPLECGGADAPSNMQWQTVDDGKGK